MAKMPVGKKAVANATADAAVKSEKPAEYAGAAVQAWAEAERLYPDRKQKISDVAALVGLAPVVLSRIAKARGWPMRTPVKSGGVTNSGASEKKAKAKSAPKPVALLRHVCSTIEGELTKLDQQSGDTSQDRERASRSLSQMVNSLEKTIKMQSEVTKDTTKGSNTKQKEELAHADDLRRQIAERLERLQQKRASADGPAGVQ
jgi:hypothetical protein